MESISQHDLSNLQGLRLAVVGHVEWVTFLSVNHLPESGQICKSKSYFEEAAGGGAVSAVKIKRLLKEPVHFFTSLGKDEVGEKCLKRLEDLGLCLRVAWKDQPTRKAISMTTTKAERAITVIGNRLQPSLEDDLPWEELKSFDGIFVTATDSKTLKRCRESKFLSVTPRLGLEAINQANITIDAIIGSYLDPYERNIIQKTADKAKIRIETKGSEGGEIYPGGNYMAEPLRAQLIDDYGCGDSFAAGVTCGLSAGWNIKDATSLGARLGADCATQLGPYGNR